MLKDKQPADARMPDADYARTRPLDNARCKARRVDAAEFMELVLSNRRLERDDGRDVGFRVLLDPATGDRFIIDDYQLCVALAQE